MSGVIGYKNRIKRNDINRIMLEYKPLLYEFASKYKYDLRQVKLTGSVNDFNKKDFGDLDLILTFTNIKDTKENRKKLKNDLANFLSNKDKIVEFIGKYYGKKYYKSGELVSVAYEFNNIPIQIDNIISLSIDETIFKDKFLSLGAIKQGLLLGLVKIFYDNIEHKDVSLTSRGLKFKTKDNPYYVICWEIVDYIIRYCKTNYNIDIYNENTYKNIEQLSERSIRRLAGMFLKMVTVKTGEVSTLKGKEKEKWIKFFEKLKNKYEEKRY